jgi:hypothetical protein
MPVRAKNQPAYLMVALFLLLLTYPAFEGRPFALLILSGLNTFLLLSAGLAFIRQRATLLIAFAIGVPWIALNWLRHVMVLGPALMTLTMILSIVYFFFLVVVLVSRALTTEDASGSTICHAVSGYLLLGIAWAAVYQLVTYVHPEALRIPEGNVDFEDYLYFSFTTLTTLGYGDITPVSPYARSIVVVEAIVGPLYLTILIARLVGMYGRQPAPRNREAERPSEARE